MAWIDTRNCHVTWIVMKTGLHGLTLDLPEDVNNFEDPDYILPEEVGENSIMTTSITRKYNLRHR